MQPSPAAFLIGLPSLRDDALWRAARRLHAPVLVSANALSVWRADPMGLRHWDRFSSRSLHLVHEHSVYLDSGGFVVAARYRGFAWTVRSYMALCAAAPWIWCAMMDACCGQEIAADENAVLDRSSMTVRLHYKCRREAMHLGIEQQMTPVLQGRRIDHYLRCADRMPGLGSYRLVGIASMRRREVGGEEGVLRIADQLDRTFAGSAMHFHLFGIKTEAARLLRGHPRLRSVDTQAYGTAARQCARGPLSNSPPRLWARRRW